MIEFTNEKQALAQISQQVWANSRVAYDKSKQVACAVKFLAIALVFGLIGAVTSIFVL